MDGGFGRDEIEIVLEDDGAEVVLEEEAHFFAEHGQLQAFFDAEELGDVVQEEWVREESRCHAILLHADQIDIKELAK